MLIGPGVNKTKFMAQDLRVFIYHIMIFFRKLLNPFLFFLFPEMNIKSKSKSHQYGPKAQNDKIFKHSLFSLVNPKCYYGNHGGNEYTE